MSSSKKLIALITGADTLTGLSTARALARLNVEIFGLARNLDSPFCQSSLWSRLVAVDDTSDAYLEKLLEIGCLAEGRIVLFATQDDLVQLISNHKSVLTTYYDFVLPEMGSVNFLLDKTEFHRWAEKQGFPVPESYISASESELNYILKHIKYPIIVKPLFRTREWQAVSPYHKVLRFADKADVGTQGFNLFDAAPRFIVQRWVPGNDTNVHFCLMYIDRCGQEINYYTGKKVLQWPRLTGSTAIGVGTENEEVHKLAYDVLTEAKLKGLGSLEVKWSDEDKKYYITEPTVGRNNLQSFIAVRGGVNLTEIAFLDARGDKVPSQQGKRRTAIWIEEYSTIQIVHSAAYEIRDIVNVVRNLKGCLAFSYWSIRDSMPFIVLCGRLLRSLLRKLRSSRDGRHINTYR